METILFDRLAQIKPADQEIKRQAKAKWDAVFKPLDGLGRLEEMVCTIAAAQDTVHADIEKRAILVLCSDNGIVREGITQSPSRITRAVAENMAAGKASINQMAACCRADVIAVDIGVEKRAEHCLDRRIAPGTKNFALEAAMDREEAVRAILTGIELVKGCKEKGYRLLATGEMGIGNTATTSALASLLLGRPPEEVTGRGAGLSDEMLCKKCDVIEKALIFHFGPDYREKQADVLTMLQCVGGFDIAGLVGVFLGGALYQIPVILDGVISTCAAVIASRLCPAAVSYMLASHLGKEPSHGWLLDELGLAPVIHGELALGEGTGAVLLIPMLDMALSVYENKETFVENKLEAYKRFI